MDIRQRAGELIAAIGSAGVLLISAIYASAPPEAVTPLPEGFALEAAFKASRNAAMRLQTAGTVGLVADILLIGGCAVLAIRAGSSLGQRLFWIWIGASTAIFVVVDGLAGEVMPSLLQSGDLATYRLARGAFDLAFVIGDATFGAGLIAAWFAKSDWAAWLRSLALLGGLIAELAFVLRLAGQTIPMLFGASVGLAAVVGLLCACSELIRADPIALAARPAATAEFA